MPADRELLDMSGAGHGEPVTLVGIIEFKWLMAREGVHVHVERLQTDRVYARQCLALAERSPIAAIRRSGQRVAAMLGLAADTS